MRTGRITSVVVPLLLVTAALSSCRRDSQKRPPRSAVKPNVIIVLFDTLRADALGAYGSRDGLTPHLDQFARHALVYRHAYAQSTWTRTSVASLLTGLYPYRHRVLDQPRPTGSLPASAITLAEVLKAADYRTAAFAMNPSISAEFGFDQGFDAYTAGGSYYTRTGKTTKAVLGYLRSADRAKSHFLYAHYLDPHDPWDRRKKCEPLFRGLSADDVNAKVLGGSTVDISGEGRIAYLPKPLMPVPDPLSAADMAYMKALYSCEVMAIDAAFGQIVAYLEEEHWLDDTLLVVTSDHGEEFMEHGLLRHGYHLYGETIQVPLLVHAPRGVEVDRAAADRIVELVDVAPTVYAIARIARAPQGMDGVALPGLGSPAAAGPRDRAFGMTGFRQQHRAYMIADGDKVIYDFNDKSCQAFNLRRDPRETAPVTCDSRGNVQALLAALNAQKLDGERRALPQHARDIDRESSEALRKQLEALGYVQ
jgi:choline-sulfatase